MKNNLLYEDSVFTKKLSLQTSLKPLELPFCLFTDIDDTYLPKFRRVEDQFIELSQKQNDLILSPTPDYYTQTRTLSHYLQKQHIPLIFVTGRDMLQFHDLSRTFHARFSDFSKILSCDIFIGAVGTEIWVKKQDNSFVKDTHFELHLSNTFKFDRESIYKRCQRGVSDISELYPQYNLRFQSRDLNKSDEYPIQPLKISLEFDTTEQNLAVFRNIFQKICIDLPHIIISYQQKVASTVNRYNIDIVPCGKDEAVKYIQSTIPTTAFVAGDSGNDADMILKTDSIGIVVGGSKSELLKKVDLYEKTHLCDSFYKININKEQKICYLEKNQLVGPQSILYALQHFKQPTV